MGLWLNVKQPDATSCVRVIVAVKAHVQAGKDQHSQHIQQHSKQRAPATSFGLGLILV